MRCAGNDAWRRPNKRQRKFPKGDSCVAESITAAEHDEASKGRPTAAAIRDAKRQPLSGNAALMVTTPPRIVPRSYDSDGLRHVEILEGRGRS